MSNNKEDARARGDGAAASPGGSTVLRANVSSDLPTQSIRGAPCAPGTDKDGAARTVWGDLQLIEEIGRGAYGCVYRAWDQTLDREVALKIIQLPEPDPAVATVLNEGRMLARIRHRNVVTVHAARQIGDEVGLVMELVRGRPLADLVTRDGPLGSEEASLIGLSLCQALAAVHSAGLLHRDIKAQNVIREAGGRIVLMDFGAVREVATISQFESASGTPLYMAPEVLAGGRASVASDIYSLGVLLYFLVTGSYPIEGRTIPEIVTAHSLKRRMLLSDRRADLPHAFVKVVDRALSAVPEVRYASAGAMQHALSETISADAGMQAEWADAGVVSKDTAADISGRRDDDASVAQRRAIRPAVFWWGALGLVTVGVWVLGFLMSMSFDLTFGRTGFSSESVFSWWVWGLRSLFWPVLLSTMVIICVWLAKSLWRLLERIAPAVRSVRQGTISGVTRLLVRMGLVDRRAIGQAIVVAQAIAVGLIFWKFYELIGSFTAEINTEQSRWLLPLRSDNIQHVWYRSIISILILAMCAVWYQLLKPWIKNVPGARIDIPSLAAGLMVIVVAVLLLEVPYRNMLQNEFPRVDLGSARCYAIGLRPGELLLHCPELPPPRNRVVSETDPRLHRLAIVESIFTPIPVRRKEDRE